MQLLDQIKYYSNLQFGSLHYYFLTLVAFNPFLFFHAKSNRAIVLMAIGYLLSLYQFRILYAIFPIILLEMDFSKTDKWFWLSMALYFILMICTYYALAISGIKADVGILSLYHLQN